jgi:hypothetical protein
MQQRQFRLTSDPCNKAIEVDEINRQNPIQRQTGKPEPLHSIAPISTFQPPSMLETSKDLRKKSDFYFGATLYYLITVIRS